MSSANAFNSGLSSHLTNLESNLSLVGRPTLFFSFVASPVVPYFSEIIKCLLSRERTILIKCHVKPKC